MNSNDYWIVHVNSDNFRIFEHDKPLAYCLQIGHLFDSGVYIGENWEPTHLKLFEGDKIQTEAKKSMPDIIDGVVTIAFNHKSKAILNPLINNYVEYFELFSEFGTFFEICVKQLDCLDEKHSEIKYFQSSGRIMKIEKFAFKWDLIKDVPIFCLPETGAKPIIVSQTFREYVLKNEIKGLIFSPIPLVELE